LFSPNRRSADRPSTDAITAGEASQGLPRLAGTIVGPNGARAIFAGADGKSNSVAEGDVIGAFKVRDIHPGLVTLTGPDGGQHELHPSYVSPPHENGGPGAQMGPRVMSPAANFGGRNEARERALSPDADPGAGTQGQGR
jgi:hypothetical protein